MEQERQPCLTTDEVGVPGPEVVMVTEPHTSTAQMEESSGDLNQVREDKQDNVTEEQADGAAAAADDAEWPGYEPDTVQTKETAASSNQFREAAVQNKKSLEIEEQSEMFVHRVENAPAVVNEDSLGVNPAAVPEEKNPDIHHISNDDDQDQPNKDVRQIGSEDDDDKAFIIETVIPGEEPEGATYVQEEKKTGDIYDLCEDEDRDKLIPDDVDKLQAVVNDESALGDKIDNTTATHEETKTADIYNVGDDDGRDTEIPEERSDPLSPEALPPTVVADDELTDGSNKHPAVVATEKNPSHPASADDSDNPPAVGEESDALDSFMTPNSQEEDAPAGKPEYPSEVKATSSSGSKNDLSDIDDPRQPRSASRLSLSNQDKDRDHNDKAKALSGNTIESKDSKESQSELLKYWSGMLSVDPSSTPKPNWKERPKKSTPPPHAPPTTVRCTNAKATPSSPATPKIRHSKEFKQHPLLSPLNHHSGTSPKTDISTQEELSSLCNSSTLTEKRAFFETVFKKNDRKLLPSPARVLVKDRHKWIADTMKDVDDRRFSKGGPEDDLKLTSSGSWDSKGGQEEKSEPRDPEPSTVIDEGVANESAEIDGFQSLPVQSLAPGDFHDSVDHDYKQRRVDEIVEEFDEQKLGPWGLEYRYSRESSGSRNSHDGSTGTGIWRRNKGSDPNDQSMSNQKGDHPSMGKQPQCDDPSTGYDSEYFEAAETNEIEVAAGRQLLRSDRDGTCDYSSQPKNEVVPADLEHPTNDFLVLDDHDDGEKEAVSLAANTQATSGPENLLSEKGQVTGKHCFQRLEVSTGHEGTTGQVNFKGSDFVVLDDHHDGEKEAVLMFADCEGKKIEKTKAKEGSNRERKNSPRKMKGSRKNKTHSGTRRSKGKEPAQLDQRRRKEDPPVIESKEHEAVAEIEKSIHSDQKILHLVHTSDEQAVAEVTLVEQHLQGVDEQPDNVLTTNEKTPDVVDTVALLEGSSCPQTATQDEVTENFQVPTQNKEETAPDFQPSNDKDAGEEVVASNCSKGHGVDSSAPQRIEECPASPCTEQRSESHAIIEEDQAAIPTASQNEDSTQDASPSVLHRSSWRKVLELEGNEAEQSGVFDSTDKDLTELEARLQEENQNDDLLVESHCDDLPHFEVIESISKQAEEVYDTDVCASDGCTSDATITAGNISEKTSPVLLIPDDDKTSSTQQISDRDDSLSLRKMNIQSDNMMKIDDVEESSRARRQSKGQRRVEGGFETGKDAEIYQYMPGGENTAQSDGEMSELKPVGVLKLTANEATASEENLTGKPISIDETTDARQSSKALSALEKHLLTHVVDEQAEERVHDDGAALRETTHARNGEREQAASNCDNTNELPSRTTVDTRRRLGGGGTALREGLQRCLESTDSEDSTDPSQDTCSDQADAVTRKNTNGRSKRRSTSSKDSPSSSEALSPVVSNDFCPPIDGQVDYAAQQTAAQCLDACKIM